MCPTETPLEGPTKLARQGKAQVLGTIFSTLDCRKYFYAQVKLSESFEGRISQLILFLFYHSESMDTCSDKDKCGAKSASCCKRKLQFLGVKLGELGKGVLTHQNISPNQ